MDFTRPQPKLFLSLLLSILLPSFSAIHGQSEVSFRHFPSDHLLSNTPVHHMTQDRQGFLWLATKQGLIRYDGLRTKAYNHHPFDPQTIPSNDIWAVCQDREEPVLWIATAAGLSRLDLTTQTFKNYQYQPDSLSNGSSPSAKVITYVMQAESGLLWLATGGGGLNSFNPATEKFSYYYPTEEKKFTSDFNHLGFVAEDRRGDIWFGTQADLFRLNPTSGKMDGFIEDIGFLKTNFALTGDLEGRIWAFTEKGLFVYEEGRFRSIDLEQETWSERFGFPWEEFYPEEVIVDHEGNVWFGGWDKGLFYYKVDSKELSHYSQDPLDDKSITHNSIYAIFEDSDQRIWVGNKGLDRFNPYLKKLSFIPLDKHPANTGFVPVTGIQAEGDDKLWLSSVGNGLSLFNIRDHSQKSYFLAAPGELQNYTRNSLRLPNGQFWAETWMFGLRSFDPQTGRFTSFPNIKGLKVTPNRFWKLHDTLIALRAEEKLFFYNPINGDLQMLPHDFSGINSGPPFMPCIMMDSKGYIWLGLDGQGLIRYNPVDQTYIQFLHNPDDPASLSDNKVYCIFEDRVGRIWAGTNGDGLNLLIWKDLSKGKATFRHWLENDSGLLSNNILAIQEDGNGMLWICTDQGISRFDPVAETFQNYNWKECGQNFMWPQVSYKAPDGTLYFGGMEGLTYFHPQKIPFNGKEPSVVFTELKVNNEIQTPGGDLLSKNIGFTEKIVFSHRQNNFSISFAALDYTQPEKNRYWYRLKGLQDQWSETDGKLAQAVYTNISPGTYFFELRGANADGTWAQRVNTLAITILPPWWRTTWAYVLWSGLILGLLYLVYRIQLHRQLAKAEILRLQELDEMKSRISTNITHEFRTPLTIILGMADQLKGQISEGARSQLNIVRRNARQLQKLVNELMDLSSLEVGRLQLDKKQADVVPFISYLTESYEAWAAKEGIQFELVKKTEQCVMDFDAYRLEQVLSNLVSNAIKFTPSGGTVSVILEKKGKPSAVLNGTSHLQIKVADTGAGIGNKKLPHIFDRFYQAVDSTTREGLQWTSSATREGSGVGLALCKELIQLMKGRIEVESEVGKGTIFTVYLPIKNEHPSAQGIYLRQRPTLIPPASAKKQALNGSKKESPMILIVENNKDLLRMLSDTLESDYSAFTAQNGQQGIDQALELIPDLIITDVMMPVKDGFELCHELKSHPLTSHVPIIMLSAKTDVEARITGLRKGADAYLGKPFRQEELRVRIQNLLEQRKKLQDYYLTKVGSGEESSSHIAGLPGNSMDQALVQKLQTLITDNIETEDLDVDTVCQALFISPSSLNRKLKALVDKTPLEYIRYIRLSKAKELLIHSDLPINIIAAKTGYPDQRYFSRLFKKETGLTPSAFRTKNQVK